MYDLLDSLRPSVSIAQEPVVCLDEKSKQLLKRYSRRLADRSPERPCGWITSTFAPAPAICSWQWNPRVDGAPSLVTDRRAKIDFVTFVRHLLEQVYATARRVHLVLDNLNTHFRKCFEEVLGVKAAQALLRRVVFHYTPKHASWLNMAEIEIGILDRQCLDRRLPDRGHTRRRSRCLAAAPQCRERRIEWTFTRQDADRKMARHYVS